MKHALYFQHSNNELTLVEENVTESNVINSIKTYIKKLNPNFKIYYIRTWVDNGVEIYDVGSHTEFFHVIPNFS